MTRLTNFVKFQGAILELLQTNCDGNQSPISTALGTTFSDRYTGSSPSVTSSSEKLTAGICSLSQETTVDASLPGPHVISNWVPLLISKNHGAEAEADYSVSIDQFFECFDGMRSSQAALANTGIWNWSCSVFSAITAASSLASGSVHIPFGSDLKKSLFLVAHPSKELFLQLKASSFFCIREAIVCQPCKLKSLCKFANQRVNKWWNLDLKDALMILFKIHDTLKNFFSWIYRGYRFCYGPHMYADISRCYKSPCVLAEPGIVSTFYSNRILCSHIHKLIFGETCRIMSLPLEILPQ